MTPIGGENEGQLRWRCEKLEKRIDEYAIGIALMSVLVLTPCYQMTESVLAGLFMAFAGASSLAGMHIMMMGVVRLRTGRRDY